MARPSVKERARLFIGKARPSISGQHGHDALFAVACGLVVGFGLGDADAFELLSLYNAQSCQPSWTDKDLKRKLDHARQQALKHPDEVGKLADADRADYTGPRSPGNNSARPKPTSGATTASGKGGAQSQPSGAPKPGGDARTVRTPIFNVRRFGEGVRSRTPRAVRTLPAYSFATPSPLTPIKESKERVSEKPEAPKPAAKPAAKPASPVAKANANAPDEKVDRFMWWFGTTGRRFRKRWRDKEWRQIGEDAPAAVVVAVKPTRVAPGACPQCWRIGRAIPLRDGHCPMCAS